MTERYDEIKQQVGILAYVSPENKGFAAVVKERYSDFIVHEGRCGPSERQAVAYMHGKVRDGTLLPIVHIN